MKYAHILILTVMLLSLAGYAAGQGVPGRYFEVGFEQNGSVIPIIDHQVILKKYSFTLLLRLRQPDGILINASFTPESFDAARKGNPLQEIRGFSDLGMAEEAFNPRAVLMLSSNAPHYWYYQHDADHRFNQVGQENGWIIGKRIIANVMYRDTTKQYVSVQDVPENTIYLVFMKTEWTQDFTRQIERQRDYVKIIFR